MLKLAMCVDLSQLGLKLLWEARLTLLSRRLANMLIYVLTICLENTRVTKAGIVRYPVVGVNIQSLRRLICQAALACLGGGGANTN